MRQSLPGNTLCVLPKYRSYWNFQCNERNRELRHFFFCGGDFCDGSKCVSNEMKEFAEGGTRMGRVTSANNDIDQPSSKALLVGTLAWPEPRVSKGRRRRQARTKTSPEFGPAWRGRQNIHSYAFPLEAAGRIETSPRLPAYCLLPARSSSCSSGYGRYEAIGGDLFVNDQQRPAPKFAAKLQLATHHPQGDSMRRSAKKNSSPETQLISATSVQRAES